MSTKRIYGIMITPSQFLDMTSERFNSVLDRVTDLEVVEEWKSEDVRCENRVHWYNIMSVNAKKQHEFWEIIYEAGFV